ncbi:MAG: hypothetical protein Q4A71_04280 [Actinomycetaceae bacterium]|nr:hypothetical protein [Actinomycetaceae bacterium]
MALFVDIHRRKAPTVLPPQWRPLNLNEYPATWDLPCVWLATEIYGPVKPRQSTYRQFSGVQQTTVYLNGEIIATHTGTTRFRVDATSLVKVNEPALLAVKIEGESLPNFSRALIYVEETHFDQKVREENRYWWLDGGNLLADSKCDHCSIVSSDGRLCLENFTCSKRIRVKKRACAYPGGSSQNGKPVAKPLRVTRICRNCHCTWTAT